MQVCGQTTAYKPHPVCRHIRQTETRLKKHSCSVSNNNNNNNNNNHDNVYGAVIMT